MKKDSISKEERFVWAASELRKAMDSGFYGKVTFNFQEGVILDRHRIPHDVAKPLDAKKQMT